MTAFSDQPWSRSEDDEPGGEAGAASPRRTPLSPGAPAEPLIYQTQQRVPGEPGMFRPRRPHPETAQDDATPATEALPTQDAPQYRRRDFSPEGRRAVPSWAPAYAHGDGGYPSAERLDYKTLGHQEVRAAVERSRGFASTAEGPDGGGGRYSAGAGAGAAAGDAAGSGPSEAAPSPVPAVTGAIPMSTPEQPLTRRQLRALREQQEREERAAAGEDAEEAAPGEPAADQPAADQPGWVDSAAPATFAVPVQPAPPAQPAEPASPAAAAEEAEPAATEPAAASDEEAPSSESLDDWMAKVFDAPQAPSRPADERGPGDARGPVALVEPPEPEHWEPGAGERPGSPAVYEALFAPPSQAEPAVAQPAEEHPAEVDPSDPLAFLGAQPSAADRVDLPAPGAWAPPSATPDSAAPASEAPESSAREAETPSSAPEDAADPTAEEIVVEEEAPGAPVDGVAELHPVVLDAQPLPAEPIEHSPTAAEVPTGHWTQQAAADDDPHSITRDVRGGHGVVTTNALVLPSIPQQELSGPLTNTGEILITGSIDLPRSLSSTGAHPTQLDESRLDHELDPGDQQVVSADSQPIRAIKAVSTHTSTRGMMLTTKPKGNRSLTVLIIVTGALALAVGAVLVVGLLSNAF